MAENKLPRRRHHGLSFDAFDEVASARAVESEFAGVVTRRLGRRGFLRGAAAFGAAAFVSGCGVGRIGASGNGVSGGDDGGGFSGLDFFESVAANTHDTVTVPAGYEWDVLVAWGDPLWSDVAKPGRHSSGSAASQLRAFGDNNDGMELFEINGRLLLAVNNEYVNRQTMFADNESRLPENIADVKKAMAAHGVSVFEIAADADGGGWRVVTDSPYNRRITPQTAMRIGGPARGHSLMRTAADASGTVCQGTWNNCGSGKTPWGTYLTCEENFNGYFGSSDAFLQLTPQQKRYGINIDDWGYQFATVDERFDIARHPNEPHRAGWVVEIDPAQPHAAPKKHTALGRFKHENAEVTVADDGRVVVYMGDDERGEFLYRFVSDRPYVRGGDGDANAAVLESGTLYAAKFYDDGSGEWLPLTPQTAGMPSAAEVCVFAREAGSAVGATTMDRPEWVAVHPRQAEVYCALTNNKHRGIRPNAGGDATPVGGANPRGENLYGQIVRWRPAGGSHTAAKFEWDLFVLAGNPQMHTDARAGSRNINVGNLFNAPDGIRFDSHGRLWILTDGNYSNAGDFAGHGNNQMLVGDTTTGEIKRFLVGPKGCEITGLTWSPDKRTAFVGIQHPGENGDSHFPHGGDALPRSAVITIRRQNRRPFG